MAWYRTYLLTNRKRDSKTIRIAALVTRGRALKTFSITFSITQGTLGNRKGRMAVAW